MTTLTSATSLASPALLLTGGDSNSNSNSSSHGSSDSSVSQVIVHPLVLLHVLDHHTRRQEASGRVIGTLLGRRDGKTVRFHCRGVMWRMESK